MTLEFSVSAVIPATPRAIFDAWLDSDGHSAMTGAPATASARVGADFTAWDGYITGHNLSLEPGRRIVQSWRTTEFGKQDKDSRIEVTLEPVKGGTRVTLHHSDVPDGHTGYRSGWQDYYFTPMKRYFAGTA